MLIRFILWVINCSSRNDTVHIGFMLRAMDWLKPIWNTENQRERAGVWMPPIRAVSFIHAIGLHAFDGLHLLLVFNMLLIFLLFPWHFLNTAIWSNSHWADKILIVARPSTLMSPSVCMGVTVMKIFSLGTFFSSQYSTKFPFCPLPLQRNEYLWRSQIRTMAVKRVTMKYRYATIYRVYSKVWSES